MVYSVLVIGPAGAGKTSLIMRMVSLDPTNTVPTVAPAIHASLIRGKIIHVWDTAGMERFNALTEGYTKHANLILSCSAEGDFVAVDFEDVILVRTKDDLNLKWFSAHCATSSKTGEGVQELVDMIGLRVDEYEDTSSLDLNKTKMKGSCCAGAEYESGSKIRLGVAAELENKF